MCTAQNNAHFEVRPRRPDPPRTLFAVSRVSRWLLLLLVEKSLLLLCFIGRTRQMMALDPEGKKSLTLEFEFFTFVI